MAGKQYLFLQRLFVIVSIVSVAYSASYGEPEKDALSEASPQVFSPVLKGQAWRKDFTLTLKAAEDVYQLGRLKNYTSRVKMTAVWKNISEKEICVYKRDLTLTEHDFVITDALGKKLPWVGDSYMNDPGPSICVNPGAVYSFDASFAVNHYGFNSCDPGEYYIGLTQRSGDGYAIVPQRVKISIVE